jgi:hypothetical protein
MLAKFLDIWFTVKEKSIVMHHLIKKVVTNLNIAAYIKYFADGDEFSILYQYLVFSAVYTTQESKQSSNIFG